MIQLLQDFPADVVAVVCRGRVTRADYEAVLVPAVAKALAAHDKVGLYYETAADFSGIDAGAVWEDFKVGTEHWRQWKRIAVVTEVSWIRHAVMAFRFLMPGDLRIFPATAAAEARAWIVEP